MRKTNTLEEHGKKLVKSSCEKESLTLLKQKFFLKKLLMRGWVNYEIYIEKLVLIT